MSVDSTDVEAPLFTVTKGQPDDAELAALTAVVLALASADEGEPGVEPGSRYWMRREALNLRPRAGVGAWRRSAWK